jgi:hypothetical protein
MTTSTNLIVSFLIPDIGTTSNWRLDSTFTNFGGGIWFSGSNAGTITNPNTSFNGGNLIGYFRMLQGQGKKVLVSIGGATFDLPNAIPNVTVATNLADSINYALFGASTPSNGWARVIGDSPATPFIFDGIDLDFEQVSATDISVMTTFVSRLRANLPAGKTLECAPEIPYFRSGNARAFNGNGVTYPYANYNDALTTLNTTSTNTLFSVNNIGLFDTILIQFYNQSNDQYPGPSPTYGSSFPYILSQAAYLCLSSTTPNRPTPKIAIGLVSDSTRSYGSPNPWPPASTIALPLWQGILDAQAIIVAARPGTVITDWLAGLMSWDSPLGQTYLSAIIATPNTSFPNNQYLYGGQNYSIPVTLGNPGWDSIPYATTSYTSGTVVPCFFGDAPVLTPSGYKRIDSLKKGDKIISTGGIQSIKQVYSYNVEASKNTNPYIIRKGTFKAREDLLISPDHCVKVLDKMIPAKYLDLEQQDMTGTLRYYNIQLEDWYNMFVAGVEVETFVTTRMIRITLEAFNQAIKEQCGELTPELEDQIKSKVKYLDNGMVICPAYQRV